MPTITEVTAALLAISLTLLALDTIVPEDQPVSYREKPEPDGEAFVLTCRPPGYQEVTVATVEWTWPQPLLLLWYPEVVPVAWRGLLAERLALEYRRHLHERLPDEMEVLLFGAVAVGGPRVD